ncbi:MAG: hypothetical protein JM58_09635 [Peptococcaceae bacterium BICA1-8]|nr:MAG: hypothetical protein JM58_09635 [Peptococcaceae bacterium BICA1-8]
MWIRSQDKKNLIKAEDIYTCQESVYIAKGKADEVKIGTYLTEERALEALDEIQKTLTELEYYKFDLEQERPKIIVYQMPKE